MVIHRSVIRNIVIAITLLAIFGGTYVPKNLIEDHILFFSVALILAGIPHGASDFLIFKKLTRYFHSNNNAAHFYLSYVLLTGTYVVVWYFLPVVAFIIFLMISAYHFGQSNWNNIDSQRSHVKIITPLLWGCAIIGVPVLIYFEQSSLIIQEIVNTTPIIPSTYKWASIFLLIFLNLANIGHLAESGVIDNKRCQKEIANFSILMFLFFTTPLLVGFGIYFVFWHSVTAVLDQYQIIRSNDKKFSVYQYIKSVLPLSLVAFAGLALLYLLAGDLQNINVSLGILFFFISVITVPHAILMDMFYETGKHHLN